MSKPKTVSEIIDALDGVSVLARAFGHENVSTVSSWKARASIPVEHWPRLIEIARAAKNETIDYAVLVDACAVRKSEHGIAAE